MSARIRHGLFALAVLAGFPLVILTDALLARGYKKEDIAKIWGGNWVRVVRAVVG